jgi:hypothetical protein
LENIAGDHEKGKRVVLFMAYLYLSFGLREEQIKRLLTGITYFFEIEGKPTGFFALAVVLRGRASVGRTIPEAMLVGLSQRQEYSKNNDQNVQSYRFASILYSP